MSRIIGIPSWVASGMLGVTVPYCEFIRKVGNLRILTPTQPFDERIDILVLPGGADVDPKRYGQEPEMWTSNPNVFLEFFDAEILPIYIQMETPIIGICRGMQTLNVHFGGTLHQDIWAHPTSEHPDETVHGLSFKKGHEQSSQYIKGDVNSRHHQALDKVASNFDVMAVAKVGKAVTDIPEIIIDRERKIFAVQYHPEDCPNDTLTGVMMNKFLNELKGVRS